MTRVLAVCFALAGCSSGEPVDPLGVCEPHTPDLSFSRSDFHDLDAIVETGVLRVALAPDPTSWFLDGNRVRGFEHDLLSKFARSKGLTLELVAEPSAQARLEGLVYGEYDVVGGRLGPVHHSGVGYVPLTETPRVIVQSVADIHAGNVVEDPEDLDGHVVRVVAGGGDAHVLRQLQVPGLVVEPEGFLLESVLAGLEDDGGVVVTRADLALPILDEHNVVVGPALPGSTGAQLAVREGAIALSAALENWLYVNDTIVRRAQERYLEQRRPVRPPHISSYDPLFRAQAARLEWGWTLLAAQAWQESRFEPAARSGAGALGLMQIMPATAGELGLDDPADPAQSIQGAATYLRRLDQYYDGMILDADARLPFVLAAYNAGMGHVDDARRLAESQGADPDDWDQVAPWMLALADDRWNRDPVVQHGFCRGSEPVGYVRKVLNRRAIYEALLPAEI